MKFWEMQNEGLLDEDGEWIGNTEDYYSDDVEEQKMKEKDRQKVTQQTRNT